jgi:hypothetical protein
MYSQSDTDMCFGEISRNAPDSQSRRLDFCQGPKVAFFAAVPGQV